MGEDNDDKTEVIHIAQIDEEVSVTKKAEPDPATETSLNLDTDPDKTIVTNIDEEPTVVVDTPPPQEKTGLFSGAELDLKDPNTQERCDPRKIRSVMGTFKVYVLRQGQSEEYVFQGLRKKGYTETEIRKGFEEYCEIRDNQPPSLMERLKTLLSRLRKS